jgi:hypothetical protein
MVVVPDEFVRTISSEVVVVFNVGLLAAAKASLVGPIDAYAPRSDGLLELIETVMESELFGPT